MQLTKNLRGIITVLNTPFTNEDTIDLSGLRSHVRYALDAGVAGFLVPAMASEVNSLTPDERSTILKTVLDEVGEKVPIIGGASAPTREERIARAKECIELGCTGVLVAVDYHDDTQYETHIREIADLAPPFLMVQDWDAEGIGAPVPLIARLFQEIDPFQALKVEVTNAGPKYTQVLETTQGQLHVSGGWAVREMPDGLQRGVHAFMPTALHHSYCAIYNAHTHSDNQAIEHHFNTIKPILDYTNQDLNTSIRFFKHLLHQQGHYQTPNTRLESYTPSPEEQATIKHHLQHAIQLENNTVIARKERSD